MVGTENATAGRQQLPLQRLGLAGVALGLESRRQVVHRHEGVGVIRSENSTTDGKHVTLQCPRLGVATLRIERGGQVLHRH